MADPHRVSSTLSPSALAATHQLLDSLWDGQPTPLSIPLTDWVTRSKSFFSFAQTNQGKIRKKIRICRTLEETYNLYCELRTAYLLLQEPKFALAYEPAVKEKGRSADFAVTFRTHTPFHVEVTRLTVSQLEVKATNNRSYGGKLSIDGTANIEFNSGGEKLHQRAGQGRSPGRRQRDHRPLRSRAADQAAGRFGEPG
ncbi:MAG: hypothetical protein R2873_04420 [Caldilineaceae bacterium]